MTTPKTTTKNEFLTALREHRGSFRVARLARDENGITRGTPWIYFDEASEEQLEKCNVRELLRDEVVLDVDEPTHAEATARAAQLFLHLERDGLGFEVWDTGSVGYHLHLQFPELAMLDEPAQKRARAAIIARYGCDPAKKTGMIAIEHAAHFKTGRPKIFLGGIPGTNVLPPYAREAAEDMPQITPADPATRRDDARFRRFLWHVLARDKKLHKVLQGDFSDFDDDGFRAEMSAVSRLVRWGFTDHDVYAVMYAANTKYWGKRSEKYRRDTLARAKGEK